MSFIVDEQTLKGLNGCKVYEKVLCATLKFLEFLAERDSKNFLVASVKSSSNPRIQRSKLATMQFVNVFPLKSIDYDSNRLQRMIIHGAWA